jgi:hypothetical protein
METNIIKVKLSIEKKEAVIAHLVFRNISGKSIYLNKQVTYYDGRVRNDYFEIKDSRGICVDYLGVMANCTRTPDEYILLGPDETINSKIPLDEFYELKEGRKYKIQYCAYNPSVKDEYWGLMEMGSNKVVISY